MASSASAGRIGGDRAPFQTWHRPETSPLPLPAIPAAPQRLPATRFLVPPAGVGGNPTSPNLYVNAAKPRKPWLPGVCKPPGRGGAGRGGAARATSSARTPRSALRWSAARPSWCGGGAFLCARGHQLEPKRARRRPPGGVLGVFICMRGPASSQRGGLAGFDCSTVLRRRGWLYSWAEGVREPEVRRLGCQRPART